MIPQQGPLTARLSSDPAPFSVDQETLLGFLLRIQKESGGSIPFHRFMAEALHHPRFGYYGAHIAEVGTRGDFSTSATVSSHLGFAIASWAITRARERGWRRLPLIEMGAGNGELARTILDRLGWVRRLRTDYLIVESSPVLRDRQKRFLRGRGVQWHDTVSSALEKLEGRALIFSNELVDAFPCRLFEKTPDGWRELGVTISDQGGLSECFIGSPSDDPWFGTLGPLPRGQRVERHDSYLCWLKTWSGSFGEGSVLTIDYGDEAPSLYKRRPFGSLRAYWKHQRLTGSDIYARFGKQDITADVNFSDLITWGKNLRWNTESLSPQGDFLRKWTSVERNMPGDLLASKEGAGDAFKILEQTPSGNLVGR